MNGVKAAAVMAAVLCSAGAASTAGAVRTGLVAGDTGTFEISGIRLPQTLEAFRAAIGKTANTPDGKAVAIRYG